ncbi:MAG: hypothetical protein GY856_05415 [bacterium]|nr:hypothetical protein [bacterium]
MHEISHLSHLIRNPIARRFVAVIVPAVLAACGASPQGDSAGPVRKVGELATQPGESKPAEPEPQKTEARAAKEIIVLLIENQERCLRIAYGASARYQDGSVGARRNENVAQYLNEEARPEIEIYQRTAQVINRLMPEAQAGLSAQIINPLTDMYNEVEQFCNTAQQADMASQLDNVVTEEINAFTGAKMRIADYVQISSAEKRRILMDYSSEIYGPRAVAGSRQGSGGDGDDILAGGNTMSAAERERKEEAWADYLAEQKRMEQEKTKRLAARQSAIEERRKAQSRETGPRVGLSPTGEAKAQELRSSAVDKTLYDNMAAWHRLYSAKVLSVKQALARYYQLDPRLRGNRVIHACQKLVQVTETLLADRAALSSPDPTVTHALKTAFTEFHHAAAACIAGEAEGRASHMAAGEKALGAAAAALRPYSLAP